MNSKFTSLCNLVLENMERTLRENAAEPVYAVPANIDRDGLTGVQKVIADFTDTKPATVDEIIDIVRNENPEDSTYDISEQALTNLGYNLITDRELNDARKIFELGIELYPDSYNIYDSYGECLIKLKEYENASKAFKKALELNPESFNSKRLLEYLKTKA